MQRKTRINPHSKEVVAEGRRCAMKIHLQSSTWDTWEETPGGKIGLNEGSVYQDVWLDSWKDLIAWTTNRLGRLYFRPVAELGDAMREATAEARTLTSGMPAFEKLQTMAFVQFYSNVSYCKVMHASEYATFTPYIKVRDLATCYPEHDSLLDETIWAHGLVTAFSTSYDIPIENRLLAVLEEKREISCSSKYLPVGGLGIYVKGKVVLSFDKDIGSTNENGTAYVLDSPDVWESVSLAPRPVFVDGIMRDQHDEVIIKPEKVLGLWTYQGSPETSEIQRLGKKYGLKVYIKTI